MTLTAHRAAAVRLTGDDDAVAARIGVAPAGYLLVHHPSDVVRQCALLTPVPAPGEVRVVVTPGRGPDRWHLDVGARDRPGLLAAFTGALADRQVDVVQAVLATWDDGAALEAFVVRSAAAPDATALQAALVASLRRPLSSPPVPDAVVRFDRDASSLYTGCEVRAADRPGLLHAFAVAIAAAGADVHAAQVTTAAGVACDRFDLSDGTGRKLTPSQEDAIRTLVGSGVAGRSRRRWLNRRAPARRR